MAFVLAFLVSSSMLNLRFLKAEVGFWFDNHPSFADKVPFAPSSQVRILPVSDTRDIEESKLLGTEIKIPKINIEAPVIFEDSRNPNIVLKRLEEGVVHLGDTAIPGEEGTSVILGHSSAFPWYKGNYGSVFALLNKLEKGDKIYLKKDGKTLVYVVSDTLIFNPLSGGNDAKIAELEKTDGSAIILMSCYPVNTSWKRLAVRADLI